MEKAKYNFDGIVSRNPEILGGTPVFTGTRVPVRSLLQHLEEGIGLEEFLDSFPTVERDQAVRLLEILESMFEPDNLDRLREIAA